MSDPVMRAHYIGVVALVTRLHAAMGSLREEFDQDGDPMQRVADDFNSHDFSVEMRRNGGTWMVEPKAAPKPELLLAFDERDAGA